MFQEAADKRPNLVPCSSIAKKSYACPVAPALASNSLHWHNDGMCKDPHDNCWSLYTLLHMQSLSVMHFVGFAAALLSKLLHSACRSIPEKCLHC